MKSSMSWSLWSALTNQWSQPVALSSLNADQNHNQLQQGRHRWVLKIRLCFHIYRCKWCSRCRQVTLSNIKPLEIKGWSGVGGLADANPLLANSLLLTWALEDAYEGRWEHDPEYVLLGLCKWCKSLLYFWVHPRCFSWGYWSLAIWIS